MAAYNPYDGSTVMGAMKRIAATPKPATNNTDYLKNLLDNSTKSITPAVNNYSYSPSSAQGPLTYPQTQQAQKTGIANISAVPATIQKPNTYVSPYAQQIQDSLNRQKERKEFSFNPDTNPVVKALQQKYMDMGNKAYENNLGASGGRINTAIAATANQSRDAYNKEFMNMIPGIAEQEYNKYRNDNNDTLNQLKSYMELDNTSYDRYNKEKLNARADETDKTNKFISTIKQYGSDYQKQINNVTNDNDTSNDYQLPYLQMARQEKVDKMTQDSIATVGQYYNDYQAEINRRQATPDNTDDRLIPYLQMARQEKLSGMASASAKRDEADRKYQLDVAKTNYDINKPYYNPNSGGGSGAEKFDSNRNFTIDDYNANIKSRYTEQEKGPTGQLNGKLIVDKDGIMDMLDNLSDNGEDRQVIEEIMRGWSISPKDFDARYNKQQQEQQNVYNLSNDLKKIGGW